MLPTEKEPGDQGARECALGVTGTVGHGPLVEDGKSCDDGVDQVNPDQYAGGVAFREERERGSADDTGDGA